MINHIKNVLVAVSQEIDEKQQHLIAALAYFPRDGKDPFTSVVRNLIRST